MKRTENKFVRVLGQAGFTLTEMMIVIAVIGLIAAVVTTNVVKRYDEAQVSTTKLQMKKVQTYLDDFRRLCGAYPTTEQGLEALSKPPTGGQCKNMDAEGVVKKVPKDSWDNEFVYASDGANYQLKSLGRDKREGGDGYAKDITSDELD